MQTPFSDSTLKLEQKKFTLVSFRFWRDQNHYSLTSKLIKMCEEILKKTAPQCNSNSLNSKKPRERPIIAPAIAVLLLIAKLSRCHKKSTFLSPCQLQAILYQYHHRLTLNCKIGQQ